MVDYVFLVFSFSLETVAFSRVILSG